MNRDPELRQRKLESLNKRYIMRRFDELDPEKHNQPSVIISRVIELIAISLSKAEDRVSKLTNIFSLEQSQLESLLVGKTPVYKLARVFLTGTRGATLVLVDRGNIDRVLKAVKNAFPYCQCTIIDRERIELRISRVSPELREERGKLVQKAVNDTRKDLKKLEYVSHHFIPFLLILSYQATPVPGP